MPAGSVADMPRVARLVPLAALGGALLLAATGCSSSATPEDEVTSAATATPTPDYTATTPPTLGEIDSDAWATRILGSNPAPQSGLLHPDKGAAPVDITQKSGSWRATVICAGAGSVVVTAKLTVDDTDTTTSVACADGPAAEPTKVAIDFSGGAPTTLALSSDAEAIYAVQLTSR